MMKKDATPAVRLISWLICVALLICPIGAFAANDFLVADDGGTQSLGALTGEDDGAEIDPAKEGMYQDARAMLESGSVIDAINALAKVGNYRDAARYADYGMAKLSYLRGDLRAAVEAFDALGDFGDAAYQKQLCETMAVHRFMKAGQFGYASLDGETVIAPAYDWAERVFRAQSAVEPEGGEQSIQNSLLPVVLVFSGTVEPSETDILPLEGKYGLLRRDGELIVPMKYDEALWTESGFAAMRQGEKTVIFNLLTGERLGSYDEAGALSEGMIAVRNGEKWGYVDMQGALLGDGFVWDSALPFTEGLAGVSLEKNAGFIDRNGNVVIELKYQAVQPFGEGLGGFRLKKRWGFMNLEGEEVIKAQYGDVGVFAQGICAVAKSGKWGLIDKENTLLLKCRYNEITEFDPIYHRAWIRNNKIWGLVNRLGEIVLKPSWGSYTPFGANGMSLVSYRKKFGYIDTMGVMRIPNIYAAAAPFTAGACGVRLDEGGVAYLNKFSNVTFSLDSDVPTEVLCGFIEGRKVTPYEETVINEKGKEQSITRYRIALSLYAADGTPIAASGS